MTAVFLRKARKIRAFYEKIAVCPDLVNRIRMMSRVWNVHVMNPIAFVGLLDTVAKIGAA